MGIVKSKEATEWQYDMGASTYHHTYESGWIHLSIEVYPISESDYEPDMAWTFEATGAIYARGNLHLPVKASWERLQDAAKVKVAKLLKLKIAHYEAIVKELEGE